jgi:hypothetical protein
VSLHCTTFAALGLCDCSIIRFMLLIPPASGRSLVDYDRNFFQVSKVVARLRQSSTEHFSNVIEGNTCGAGAETLNPHPSSALGHERHRQNGHVEVLDG